MSNTRFELTFTSSLDVVKGVISQVMLFINENFANLSTDDLFDLKLMFSELLCNAVIHGNKLDKAKTVTIEIDVVTDKIYAKISDQGPGFDYEAKGPINEINITEHGRGIKLVHSLADELRFVGIGNAVEFHKKVAING